MQYQLAVAEIHAFRVTGGAGGVESGGDAVLVEIREVEVVAGPREQGFVLAVGVERGVARLVAVGYLNPGFDGFDLVFHALDDGQEVIVHQYRVVFGVVHGVNDLLRRQAHVDRVQYGANHRNRKETLQVPWGIPIHHSHGIAGFYTGICQGIGKSMDAFDKVLVGVLAAIGVNDFLVRVVAGAGHQ